MEAHEIASSDVLFPAPLLSDPEPETLVAPLLQQLRHMMKTIYELPASSSETGASKAATIAQIRQLIQDMHLRFAGQSTESIHHKLRAARQHAQINLQQFAQLSGFSVSQIKRAESDDPRENSKVSQETLLTLCAVPELHLIPKDLLKIPRYEEATDDRANFIVTSGFDPMGMHREMKRVLRHGGSLEQSHVYMEHESANDWMELCNTPGYVSMFRHAFPHREAAKCVAELLGKQGLDLVMLGPGDGKTEVLFVKHVLAETENSTLRVYLIDVSQPLLNKAYNHALDALGRDSRVTLWPIQGSFHELARYKSVNASPHTMHRRRVYTMFGNTLANVDNEVTFLKRSFSGAARGDLLIFDADQAFTLDVHDPAKIKAADPILQGAVPQPFQQWLLGPIRRHCHEEAQRIHLAIEVDANRPVPGSYGTQAVATVHPKSGRSRELVMWNVRRYDLDKLSALVQRLGWTEVGRYAFSSTSRPRSLFVFQRKE